MAPARARGRGRGYITYPTGRLLGVIDDREQAGAAVAELVKGGFERSGIAVLEGDEGREGLSRLGPPPSLLGRIIRTVQFLSMDQTPDFLVYERALDDGRLVLAIRVADRPAMIRARDVLEDHGAHFLNHFGRLMTEEVSRWRGPEPEIPDALRR
jgi:hypothetical protein